MKSPANAETAPAPITEVEHLLSPDQRRVSDAYVGGPAQARPADEVERVLSILDELEMESEVRK